MRAKANALLFVHATLFLNPYRPSGLLAAKGHWTFAFPLPTPGKGLTLGLKASKAVVSLCET